MYLTGDRLNGWSRQINGFCYEVHELGKGILYKNVQMTIYNVTYLINNNFIASLHKCMYTC